MSGQTQVEKARQKAEAEAPVEHIDVKPQDMKASEIIDDILDAIDEVLEENSQEFVSAFVQAGGQ